MRAVRKINLKMVNKAGQELDISALDKKQFILKVAFLKKNGFRVIKESISVSDTIVVGNTSIIKKCA